MMNFLRTGTFVCLLFCAGFVFTNSYADGDKKSQDCWQTAMTQSELNQCAGKHAQSAREKLENAYNKILEEYAKDAAFIKAFKASQQAWIAYREAQMKMMFPHADEPIYYGSVFPMCTAQYREELTKARTAQLMQWLEGTPEGNVCSGSIKTSPDAKYASMPPLETKSPRTATACHAAQSR